MSNKSPFFNDDDDDELDKLDDDDSKFDEYDDEEDDLLKPRKTGASVFGANPIGSAPSTPSSGSSGPGGARPLTPSYSSGGSPISRPGTPGGSSGTSGTPFTPPQAPTPPGSSGSSGGYSPRPSGVTGTPGGGSGSPGGGKPSLGDVASRPPGGSGGSSAPPGMSRPGEPRRDEPKSGGIGGFSGGPGSPSGAQRPGEPRRDEPRRDEPKKDDGKKDAGKPADKKEASGGIGGFMSRLSGGDKKDDGKKDAGKPAKPEAKKADDGGKPGPLGGLASKLPFGKKDDKADDAKKAPSASAAAPGARPGGSGPIGGSSAPSSTPRPGGGPIGGSAGSGPGGASAGSGFGAAGRAGAPAPAAGKPDDKKAGKPAKAAKSGGGPLAGLKRFNPFAPRQTKGQTKRTGKVAEVRPLSIPLDKALEVIGIVSTIGGLALLLSSLSPARGSIPTTINEFLSTIFGVGAIAVPIVMVPLGIMLIRLRAGEETPIIELSRVIGFVGIFVVFLTAAQFIDALNYPPGEGQSFELWLQTLRDVFLPISADLGRGGGRVGGFLYFNLISLFGELAGVVIIIGVGLLALMFAFSLNSQDIYRFVLSIALSFGEARRRRAMRSAALKAEREARAREALAAAAPAVSTPQIAAPTPNALPASATLPLPTERPAPALVEARAEAAAEQQRAIPITMGGRTTIAPLSPGAAASDSPSPVLASPAGAPKAFTTPAAPPPLGAVAPAPVKPADTPAPRPLDKDGGAPKVTPAASASPVADAAAKPGEAGEAEGKSGGLFGRVRGALPFAGSGANKPPAADAVKDKPGDQPADKAAEAATSGDKRGPLGGFGSRFGLGAKPGDKPNGDKAADKPADKPSSPPAAPVKSGAAAEAAKADDAGKPGISVPGAAAAALAGAGAAAVSALIKPDAGSGAPAPTAGGPGGAPRAFSVPGPAPLPTRPASPVTTPSPFALDDEDDLNDDDDLDQALSELDKLAGIDSKPTPAASAAPARPLTAPSPLTGPAAPLSSGASALKPPAKPSPRDEDDVNDDDIDDDDIDDDDIDLDDLDDDARDGQASVAAARSGVVRPTSSLNPAAGPPGLAKPPAAPLKPAQPAAGADPDDDDDDVNDADDAPSGWKALPPAQPRSAAPGRPTIQPSGLVGTPLGSVKPPTPAPAKPDASPAGSAKVEPPAAESAAKPADIPDLQTRLAALRGMSQPEAKDKPASDKPAPETATQDARAVEKPAAATPPAAPKPATPEADKPKAGAFGKPDDLMHGETFVPPAVSRPATSDKFQTALPARPDDAAATAASAPKPVAPRPTAPAPAAPAASPAASTQTADQPVVISTRQRKSFSLPDYTGILQSGMDQEMDQKVLLERVRMIEDTLSSFGAPGRVVEVRTGPVITQFGVEPDYIESRGGKKNRVKVSAIAALDKDLQLALGAKSIRIEAPVPGKGYVGIEVPNERASIVRLRDVLEAQEFRKINSPLAIALGQSVDGTPVAADLTSMPHLLIAGTTGSGKSVCVNAIIASLLIKNTPDRVKFIMVDPKRVELTGYNGIPHLVAPVVVELERVVSVLKWVTREMDERYRKFSNAAARNIEDYNRHLPQGEAQLPYIVVIIDELADLMMMAPDETERVVTRIAALARATGIHLVLATQRPSVDVVTGLIKANFPARIAFAVAGGVDSRVILDQPGAERLLGRGDMLYMSGDTPAPQRLQGVYVSDQEISNIVRFWRQQLDDADLAALAKPMISTFQLDEAAKEREVSKSWSPTQANRPGAAPPNPPTQNRAIWDGEVSRVQSVRGLGEDEDDTIDDALYEQAVDLVRRQQKASVSLLQRKLRIGYTRAARLMDVMEERGIVGPPVEGSRPRDVLPPKA